MPHVQVRARALFRRARLQLVGQGYCDSTQVTRFPNGATFGSYVLCCVRCEGLTPLASCDNCGSSTYTVGEGRRRGVYCAGCEIGFTRWTCAACGTDNPVGKTLCRLYVAPRVPSEAVAWGKLALFGGAPAGCLLSLFVAGATAITWAVAGFAAGLAVLLIVVAATGDWRRDRE